ncbi:alpha/beta fold hydrolase [Streptomyces sp. SAI-127]|uniref:thioesterase II family protein n=1 Tax=Streptomyces sp. SAI-127 TaxID=2940543 RepID=UPI002474BC80|nr:alpha/beta fold hydrolase [Streptomyces sp. SAI-127]MDH6486624.1 pyochelin biosynthetic protein PchC [Streptomyces sp. SAI-127]
MHTRKATTAELWLRPCGDAVSRPRRRLVCLPHAGGTANTYTSWPALLPSDIGVYAVQYPGRQDRYGEPAADSIEKMADEIASAVEPFTDEPLTVFGHSMGAYVAYEVAVELERRRGPVVDLLVVSGVTAPHRKQPGEVHRLPDAEFAAEVARDNESFADLLASPELVEVLLPMIRDDYRLFEIYQPGDPPAVRAPVLATGGVEDPDVDHAGLASWGELTTGGFDVGAFPGGHFYLVDNEAALAGRIAERMPSA